MGGASARALLCPRSGVFPNFSLAFIAHCPDWMADENKRKARPANESAVKTVLDKGGQSITNLLACWNRKQEKVSFGGGWIGAG